jgi:hypothetical protein
MLRKLGCEMAILFGAIAIGKGAKCYFRVVFTTMGTTTFDKLRRR